MSAIVAILHRDGSPVDPSEITPMLEAGRHRAVDRQQSWADRDVALAHQNFVLDPGRPDAPQPLVADDGSVVVSLDGRLDNRSELTHILELPADSSDARLLLGAYGRWGSECPSRLVGDFAFAVWDSSEQRILLARDRLGVRDLCYYSDSNLLVVASEISHVLGHPGVQPEINEVKVGLYLAGSWDDQEPSFYRKIHYFPPGHILEVTRDQLRMRRYWDLDPHRRIHYRDNREYAEHFRELLITSVRHRIPSEGKVAVSLSGGPDSATVAALAARETGSARVRAYSYVFEEFSSCDESAHIEDISRHCGIDSTRICGDRCWPLSDFESWPVSRSFASQDAFVRLPTLLHRACAASGIRILLTGHVSDLLFSAGRLWAADLIASGRLLALLSQIVSRRDDVHLRRDVLNGGFRALAPRFVRSVARPFRRPPAWLERLSPGFIERTDLLHRLRADDRAEPSLGPAIGRRRARQLSSSLVPQSWSELHPRTNALSVEVIDPYWNPAIVEFVLAVPANELGGPGQTKLLLRRAARGVIPERVRLRSDKTALTELFNAGLLGHERHRVGSLLGLNARVFSRDIVDPAWVRRELEAGAGWTDGGFPLWLVLCLELWIRRFWERLGDD